MSRKDDTVYIYHMIETAHKVEALLQDKERDDYDRDELLRLALTYLIQTIGESARRVSQPFREMHPEISWSDIIGMRHKVVHDYLKVDFNTVWETATRDLPVLRGSLEKIVPPDDVSQE